MSATSPVEPASLAMALARPLLFAMDAEAAHHAALAVLRRASALPRVLDALASGACAARDPRLAVEVLGLRFPNPLGVAAGLDKDAVAIPALAALGFGFVEAGTVTPEPQEGNEKPRVFRLPPDGAAINRLGFPSEGAVAVAARLRALGSRPPCIVGVNIGKNKRTPNDRAAADYVAALGVLRGAGDYVVINVSSPNTPGLRALQDAASLKAIVGPVVAAAGGKPVLVKLSPDMEDADFDAACESALGAGARGLVVANTSSRRPADLRCVQRSGEAGGLSGLPLRARALQLVGRARRLAGTGPGIIGVGGVASGDDARRLLEAGADLVQAYTAFVYAGPGFARRVLRDLLAGA